jgi:hypothetical protein
MANTRGQFAPKYRIQYWKLIGKGTEKGYSEKGLIGYLFNRLIGRKING